MSIVRGKRKLRLTWIDAVVLAAVAGFTVFIVRRVESVLNYSWDWGMVMPFFVYVDRQTGEWALNLMIEGLIMTMRPAVYGIIASAVIGVVMGLARVSNNLFLRMVARSYVELVRNIPPLVFIFIFYFFLSTQLMPLLGIDELARSDSPTVQAIIRVVSGDPVLFSNFVSGLVCLSLFEGAYITEIVRAGVQSIPPWAVGGGPGRRPVRIRRDALRNHAAGSQPHCAAAGKPVHHPDQGLLDRIADFDPGADLHGRGSRRIHVTDLRDLDHHRGHVLRGVLLVRDLLQLDGAPRGAFAKVMDGEPASDAGGTVLRVR
ncbi:MAG: ABC transporter permease subunit [Gammaproteobacteria bacterium]|nr:ABC transporter permease subunit [Gammaproteobacteria bacterium]